MDARVPSHDDPSLGGHAKRWNIEVPRAFHGQVSQFVESGTDDFNNLGEFVRVAVLIVMDYLERLEPKAYPSNTQILKAIALEVNQSRTRREYLSSIEDSSREAYELMGLGLDGEAERLVAGVLERIRERPKRDPWRRLYLTAFQQKFGHLLKRSKITDLTTFDSDEEDDGEDQDQDSEE